MYLRKKLHAPDGVAGENAGTQPAASAPVTMAAISALVAEVTSKAIGEALEKFKGEQKATRNTAGLLDAAGQSVSADDEPVIIRTSGQKHVTEGTGLGFVRFVKAQATAKLTGQSFDSVIRAWEAVAAEGGMDAAGYALVRQVAQKSEVRRSMMMKALGQSTFVDGGAMVPPKFSTEFIELLRNATVIRKAGARSIPLEGSLTIPRQTAGGTASYIGEHQAITPSQQTLGDITLSEKTLVAMTIIGNRLIANASMSAEQFVLEDLRNVMSLREDLAFIFGDGASGTPRGLTSLLASAQQYDATAVAPKAPTLAELRTEFAKAIKLLKTNNQPMIKPVWIMSPRVEQYLLQITDGNGNAVFESQMEKGTLRGFPYLVTNQIPETMGNTAGAGADWSRLMLIDVNQEIIGDAQTMEALVVPNGTYEESGSAKSGLARDQTVVRLIARHDHNVRYDTCGVVIAAEWGAP